MSSLRAISLVLGLTVLGLLLGLILDTIFSLGLTLDGALDNGTVHERMIKRLERIERDRPHATYFVSRALESLTEDGWTILEGSWDNEAIDINVRYGFQSGRYGGLTLHSAKQVIINPEYTSRLNIILAETGKLINEVLIHEMVHVLNKPTVDTTYTASEAEKQLYLCLDDTATPPGWVAFEDAVFGELLAETVVAAVFYRSRDRYQQPAGSDYSRRRKDPTMDTINSCFERVFGMPLIFWARRFTAEEAAILEARVKRLRYSVDLDNKMRLTLWEYRLVR